MMKTHEINGVYTRIEKSTSIKGNLKTNSDIRIDGTMDGNIETKGKIIVGRGACVKGNILCLYAVNTGHMHFRTLQICLPTQNMF